MEKKISKIEEDIKIMESTNDLKMQMRKFKKNTLRISDVKESITNINQKLIDDITDSELNSAFISEEKYYKNIKMLEEMKKSIESNDKIENLIENYIKSKELMNECRRYLENQKIEIENIE